MEAIVLVVIAGVATLVSSLVKMPWFTKKVKVLAATITSVVGAAVYTFVTGDIEGLELIPLATQVFGLQQLLYLFILDGTTLDDVLEHVGVKTKFEE